MKNYRHVSNMPFQKPLKAHLTIEEVNGMSFSSSKSKEIDVHTIDSTGLSFTTDLDFPTREETSLTLKIKFFALGEVTGELTKKEIDFTGCRSYDLKVIGCSLQFLKTFASLHETPVDRMSYQLIS